MPLRRRGCGLSYRDMNFSPADQEALAAAVRRIESPSLAGRLAALAGKRISSAELVDFSISRIEALDTNINAVVVRDFERARGAALAADSALARGEARPLLGLPMTVKEMFNVAGLPTTWGDPNFKDWRPIDDALAVARLKSAGAVILGKTNCDEFAMGSSNENSAYGPVRNPEALDRVPGGSSGGTGVAVCPDLLRLGRPRRILSSASRVGRSRTCRLGNRDTTGACSCARLCRRDGTVH